MSLNDEPKLPFHTNVLSILVGLKEWFSENSADVLKSFVEVCVTICFTFIPFFFLSIRWLQADGSNTSKTLWDTFTTYWQAGEIVLPILGLCGGVTALLALNAGYFAWWVRSLVGILILVFTLGIGAALFVSDGFSSPLNSGPINVGFFAYAFLAFVWFLLSARVRTTEARPRDSDNFANSILDEVNGRRGTKRRGR